MKVVIIGLGAVGVTFANKFKESEMCELYILLDKTRLQKYKKQPPHLNGIPLEFNYILPDEKFEADLIIISTKASGLNSAIESIKNFAGKNTIIISLLNGISSENIIKKAYPNSTVLKSYFIGHSAVRNKNNVTQDGVGEIVAEKNQKLEHILKTCKIDYKMPDNIEYSMWLKFTMNIFSNQTSAILNMTFGELKNNLKFRKFAKKIINEVRTVAEACNVSGLESLEHDAMQALDRMCNDGKTSMHQDIISGRKTEVDIFAGEIIRLGKIHNIETPYNNVLYDLIKILEERQ